MRCFARCVFNLFILFLILAGVSVAIGRQLSGWLSRSDDPKEADAIIVLGSQPIRALEGAELYRRGFAKRVYLTVPRRLKSLVALEREGVPIPWFDEAGRTILIKQGVPPEAIGLIGKDLRSTYSEALATKALLGGTAKRIIVTTSPPHVNRARMIFADALPGVEVLAIGDPNEEFPRDWWNDPDVARYVVSEVVQTLFYLAGGRFP